MTPPETALWLRLRQRQPGRPTFRRQHPVDPYILDFYCARIGLAIEIDGLIHGTDEQQAHDLRRTAWLNTQGIDVLRFHAQDVFRNLDEITEHVWSVARSRARGD